MLALALASLAGYLRGAVSYFPRISDPSAHAHAVSGITTSELFLCIGPTANCPSTGTVSPSPPYQPMLAMRFGQTWNGTMDAYANDGSAITGTISLIDSYNGGLQQTYCTVPVAAGGTCNPSIGTTIGTAVGTHVLTAAYSGDATHAGSVSAAVTIIVSQETTVATLTGTPNPAIAGQPVVLAANVAGGYTTPSGMVSFTSGGAVIGMASLAAATGNNATAEITTSTLLAGQNTITAVYASSTDFTSASAAWVQTVLPAPAAGFTLSVVPNPVTVGVGAGAAVNVTVTPANGFVQDVKLSCANLPPEVTCQFADPTVAGGSGMTSLIVQTTAPHSCGTSTPYILGSNDMGGGAAGVFAAALLVVLLPVRRGLWPRLLVALVAIAGAAHLTGCGNCTDLGTRPAAYSIEITGTAQNGGASPTASQSVSINVTI